MMKKCLEETLPPKKKLMLNNCLRETNYFGNARILCFAITTMILVGKHYQPDYLITQKNLT